MTEIPHEIAVNFMEQAIAQALTARDMAEVPIGAVIVSQTGEILAVAHNSPVSLNDPTAHAEILAIRKAAEKAGNYRLPGTTMFVTIEPCPMCAGAMIHARVKRVFFGASDPKGGAFGSVMNINSVPGLNHRIEVHGGLLASRCAHIIRDFFAERRMAGEIPPADGQ